MDEILPFDCGLVEARLTLNLISSDEMASLAWDALEAGLDGPAIRRLAALDRPTAFQVSEILPKAMGEMELVQLEVPEAARRLAKSIAKKILEAGTDPLRHTRVLGQLWIGANYQRSELADYGRVVTR